MGSLEKQSSLSMTKKVVLFFPLKLSKFTWPCAKKAIAQKTVWLKKQIQKQI